MKDDPRESRTSAVERQKMRASDSERDEVVNRLRMGLEEGRLKMDEYLDRMGQAYQAVTYGDLAALDADLPVAKSVAKPDDAALPQTPARAATVQRASVAGLPTALKVLWTIWLSAVLINVVIWVLASITSAHLVYPWPLWVAGPAGAALTAVSVGVSRIRRSRQPAAKRGPAGRR